MAKKTTKKKTTKKTKEEYVKSEDFNQFKTSVVGILEEISNKLNQEPERRVVMAGKEEKQVDPGSISNTASNEKIVHNLEAISSVYQEIFEKYFDPEDGFKAMLNGINFKIEVPKHLSNAIPAWLDFYGVDVRHKVLDGHDISGTMDKYCRLVAQNLDYRRNVKLKI